MRETVVSLPRRVIPRWRDFETTLSTGELGGAPHRLNQEKLRPDLLTLKERWAGHQNVLLAGELLSAAYIAADATLVNEASKFLLDNTKTASRFAIDFAHHAKEHIIDAGRYPQKEELPKAPRPFNTRTLHTLRRSLSAYPRNAIQWSELALAYAIIGKEREALRAITIAAQLAPNDRFVLRCATRCFLHFNFPESAKKILLKSSKTPIDSWLLSALLSVSTIMGESPPHFRQIKAMIADESKSPLELSELRSGVATLEIVAGKERKAKQLFRRALEDPTENALSQALWAQNSITIFPDNAQINELPFGYEADARLFIHKQEWKQALEAANLWQIDEPFSARPAVLSSYLASAAIQDYGRAVLLAEAGLRANPSDATLINNLAYAKACASHTAEARQVLSRVRLGDLEIDEQIVITATQGLIFYREGRIEEGRERYRSAIEIAHKGKMYDYILSAICHACREEMRVDLKATFPLISQIKRATERHEKLGIILILAEIEGILKEHSLTFQDVSCASLDSMQGAYLLPIGPSNPVD